MNYMLILNEMNQNTMQKFNQWQQGEITDTSEYVAALQQSKEKVIDLLVDYGCACIHSVLLSILSCIEDIIENLTTITN